MKLFILLLAFSLCSLSQSAATRERLSLNKGWRFYQGDINFPVIKGHAATYNSCKAGQAPGAAAPDFDDTGWRLLDLPHDWAVEEGFNPDENLSQGFRERGIGWYRRHFRLDPSDKGRHLELQFEGIATHCVVWVNGTLVHRNWCGYTSFYIDMTALARYDNQLTATKNNFDPADLDVLIPAKEGTREINVLIEAEPGKPAGMSGAVTVTSL